MKEQDDTRQDRRDDGARRKTDRKPWMAPEIEVITPVKRTAGGPLVKSGVENIVYTPS